MNSAEFWMTVTFFCVVFISIIPLKKYLSLWGEKRAKQIKEEINNAEHLFKNASYLLEKSQKKLQNKDKDVADILQKATEKSSFLLYQTQLDCAAEYHQKRAELSGRLKNVQKQADVILNQKMIDLTLALTKQSIRQKIKNQTVKKRMMQQDVDAFLSQIQSHKDTFRKILSP